MYCIPGSTLYFMIVVFCSSFKLVLSLTVSDNRAAEFVILSTNSSNNFLRNIRYLLNQLDLLESGIYWNTLFLLEYCIFYTRIFEKRRVGLRLPDFLPKDFR